MTHENNESEQLPQTLIDQLKAADRSVSLITSKVDREILQQAEAQFQTRRAVKQRPVWVAIAASVLIAFFVVQLREPPVVENDAMYADIDRSGQIDIADVLAAARLHGTGEKAQAQIDAFALRVVSLNAFGDPS